MLDPDLSMIELLGLAVAQEVASYKRYQLFALRVSNPLVKAKFSSLAKEEYAHRDMLYKMLQKLTHETKPPLPRKPPRANEDMDTDKPLEEILKLAIKKEHEAMLFYRSAAEKSTDPTGRLILNHLATLEEGHERSLQAELDTLTQYPEWFALISDR